MRHGVSAIVRNAAGRFLIVKRNLGKVSFWDFSQGGIEAGESEIEALRRELFEELGSKKFKIVGKSGYRYKYYYSKHTREMFGFKGQVLSIYFAEFLGKQIRLDQQELTDFQWVSAKKAIAPLKYIRQRTIYKKAMGEFYDLGIM